MSVFTLPEGRPALMGILNVTPDSFSDGGLYIDPGAAVKRAHQMVSEGADLIDVGGESTRPGADPVPASEEMDRVLPVISLLASQGVFVSIDTSKAAVAKAALDAGAVVVNDVTAFGDPGMADACSAADCMVCLMHMRGDPKTMQSEPQYDNVVSEVRDYLVDRARIAEEYGIASGRIWLDPGIGFGKSVEHNLDLLRHLDQLAECGYPVLIGVSRKSFIGRVLGPAERETLGPDQRLEGALAAQVIAQAKGARIIRTHDVAASRRAMAMTSAVAPWD